MKVLGVDPGTKRIGVALGDTDVGVATPLTTVPRDRDPGPSRAEVARLVDEWEARAVVVGLPLTLGGKRGPAAEAAEGEAAALRSLVTVPVALYDERLTTVTAERMLRDGGLGGRDRRARVDASAAAVMLQAWLDGRAAGVVTDISATEPGQTDEDP